MIDFIIPVRDRSNIVIRNCINSLKSDITGKIIIVDYGSEEPVYIYQQEVVHIPREKYSIWNKSHALNIGIRQSENEYIGAVDADTIVSPTFFDKVKEVVNLNTFIIATNIRRIASFINYKTSLASSTVWAETNTRYKGAIGGIQIYPREWAIKYKGYDESLIYWGGPDTYMFELAKRTGLTIIDLDEIILHQEHILKKEFQLKDRAEQEIARKARIGRTAEILRKIHKLELTNSENWGKVDYEQLNTMVQV